MSLFFGHGWNYLPVINGFFPPGRRELPVAAAPEVPVNRLPVAAAPEVPVNHLPVAAAPEVPVNRFDPLDGGHPMDLAEAHVNVRPRRRKRSKFDRLADLAQNLGYRPNAWEHRLGVVELQTSPRPNRGIRTVETFQELQEREAAKPARKRTRRSDIADNVPSVKRRRMG